MAPMPTTSSIAGTGTVEVDTENLNLVSAQVQAVSQTNATIALRLAPIAAQVSAVFAAEPSGAGFRASSILGSATVRAGVLSASNGELAGIVISAAAAYEQAESIAQQLLENIKEQVPNTFYTLGVMVAPWDKETNFWEIMGDENKIMTALIALTLFGTGYYMDLVFNGPDFATKRLIKKLDELGLPNNPLEFVGHTLSFLASKMGLDRDLNKDSVRHRDISGANAGGKLAQEQQELAGRMVIPATATDYAHNLDIVQQLSEYTDLESTADGQWIEYDGIFFQKIYGGNGVVTDVIAYIPGTDGDNYNILGGSSAGWLNIANTLRQHPEQTLEDTAAYLQLLDEGLNRLGLDGSEGIHLAGFSQGAMIAAQATTNQEFRAKHNVKSAYIQGGAVGHNPLADDIPITVVQDAEDSVPNMQGHVYEQLWGTNVEMIETDYYSTEAGQREIAEEGTWLKNSHGASQYTYATEASDQANRAMGHMQEIRESAGADAGFTVEAVEGSTRAPAQQRHFDYTPAEEPIQ